jgi:hypothetical protein
MRFIEEDSGRDQEIREWSGKNACVYEADNDRKLKVQKEVWM